MVKHGRERLAEYIKRSRLKQYEVADLVQITAAYLSQVLSGKRRPSLPIAVRIQTHTGVPVESWMASERGKSGKTKRASTKSTPISPVLTDGLHS
jgi:transcriptional regulator with XRE-family HTH domain